MRIIKMIKYLSIYRNKIGGFLIFCVYLFCMSYTYFYYKSLAPAFHSSVTKNRPYLINTEGYKLPDYDPFDESILRYLQPSPKIDCSDGMRPLTSGISNYKGLNSSELKSAIIIRKQYLADYNVISFSCCYKAIRREAANDPYFKEHLTDPVYNYPDAKYFLEKRCHSLQKRITIVNEEAVLVQCNSSSLVFYRNIHFFVPFKRPKVQDSNDVKDRLNVMIMGLDSVSRLNMQRYMPKTFAYLKEIALDLKGFNKNFENTYPNMLAMTTGFDYSEKKFRHSIAAAKGYYDEVPFIWKNFSAAGYSTFFGEDCSPLGVFAFKSKKGFKKTPTDYYFRPFMKAFEEILGSNDGHVWISGCKICGPYKLILQHILDYGEIISKYYGNMNPYFSLLWSSSLTHDRLHFAGAADKPVLKFLRNMNENNHWNNTIVFFMSDHGVRFGGIRETYLGKQEENLPMSFIILPKWFKDKFPTAYKNLIHNQDRLTTTLDLHETLLDLSMARYKNETYLKQEHNVSEHSVSLFRKVSSSRSCFNAKIPLNYCSGQLTIEVPESYLGMLAAKSILSKLNKGLSEFPKCHQLSDFVIKKSFVLQFYERDVISDHIFFELQMMTYPGEALLEGIVKVNKYDSTYKLGVIGEVSRINSYANQSYCINDIEFIKYCFCKTN